MNDIETRLAALALVSAALTCNTDQQTALISELCADPHTYQTALSELVLACARLTEQIWLRGPQQDPDLLTIWSSCAIQENRLLHRET